MNQPDEAAIAQRAHIILGSGLLVISWLMVNLSWELTGPPTLVSGWLGTLAGNELILSTGFVLLIGSVITAAVRRDGASLRVP